MTKSLLSIFLFTALLWCQSTARAGESFLFLSYDQFSRLTKVEQTRYIETVQELILHFDEARDTAPQAQILLRANTLLSQLLPFGHAADSVLSSEVVSADAEVENANIETRTMILHSLIEALKNKKTTADTVEGKLTDAFNRIRNLSRKNLDSQQWKNLMTNIADLKTRYAEAIGIAPEFAHLSLAVDALTTIEKSKRNMASASRVETAGGLDGQRRCIYAGFIITALKCSPQKELAKSQRLQELGQSEFKCKSSSEILCNPLVFGYQVDLSPYCTTRSSTASKNCQAVSNNTDNLARVHKAWANPANKKVYDDFQSSLNQLCEADRKGAVVRATCKVVVAQFNEKVKKEFPAQIAASSSAATPASGSPTGSTTDKSSRKN